MPELTSCPSCTRQLRVPDELIGKAVKCPQCGATFTAQVTGMASAPPPLPPSPPVAPSDTMPEAPPGRAADEEYADEPRPRRRPRRQYEPHRGTVILVLGIVAIVMTCFPLGIAAWVMGESDLRKMREGTMDPEGQSMTNAGRICGMISLALAALQCCMVVFIIAVQGMAK